MGAQASTFTAGNETMIAAGQRWQNAWGGADDIDDGAFGVIGDAETAMVSATGNTIEAVAIPLWAALMNQQLLSDPDDERAIIARDLAHFANNEHLDWWARLVLAALRSLHAMQEH